MLSIAICTYNRAEHLAPLLEQLLSYRDWLTEHCELLIIDNASNDNTAQLIDDFSDSLSLTSLYESRQGLAHARNCALLNFQGEAILFLDDDVTVTLDTLQTYVAALNSWPDHVFFAGPISVDWQGQRPEWLKSNDLVLLNGLFGHYDLGQRNIDYQADTLGPFGANFMLRRSMVTQLDGFDASLGVSGQHLGRGEETEYIKRAHHAGLRGKYLAAAKVGHRFQLERINILYLYRYGIQKGRAEVILESRRVENRLTRSLSFALRGVWQLLRGRRDRFYQCIINIGILTGMADANTEFGLGGKS